METVKIENVGCQPCNAVCHDEMSWSTFSGGEEHLKTFNLKRIEYVLWTLLKANDGEDHSRRKVEVISRISPQTKEGSSQDLPK